MKDTAENARPLIVCFKRQRLYICQALQDALVTASSQFRLS